MIGIAFVSRHLYFEHRARLREIRELYTPLTENPEVDWGIQAGLRRAAYRSLRIEMAERAPGERGRWCIPIEVTDG